MGGRWPEDPSEDGEPPDQARWVDHPERPDRPAWVDDAPTDPRLPALFPPAPPRSGPAAVLLNLTGLGLGYAYLGRWARAAVAAAGAVALVVVAYATDAANSPGPWRLVAVAWFAALALDAARIATRHPRPPARATPVLAGALAVVLVAGAYAGYGLAGHAAHTAGLAAQAGGNCAAAVDEFEAVTGFYELTLSPDVAAAARGLTECGAYTWATEAQRAGEHATAVARYRHFRQQHPGSPLDPHVHQDLVETYATWARGLRDGGKPAEAVEVYRDLLREDASFRDEVADAYLRLARAAPPAGTDAVARARGSVDALLVVVREFGGTPAAAEVPAALDAVYGAAAAPLGRGEFCAAAPALEYFAGLTDPALAKAAADARAHFPRAVLECGLGQLREGRSDDAVTALERFVGTFPDHGDAARARSALISAKVAAGTGARVPVPAPLGAEGSIPVTFVNGVSAPVTVRVAGSTAHEFTLPGCGDCPPSFPPLGGSAACPSVDGLPARTVRLDPGEHHVLGEYGRADALAEPLGVGSGQPDLFCLYLERWS
ncbi:tetratricopeptide repeat protein [Saccharothrix syringae]|uniref:Tetratricopeptide repeat protein n=1 Tax=Saccharothrix syringae TaxID=103733 RepID=A0A5Q0GZS3_SACSY|nr:tetratricopeptide repeat protein [Saccharothrix syringae]QFZ19497.1 tetratricopeptide repeat protein [Saccharothrix syringae]